MGWTLIALAIVFTGSVVAFLSLPAGSIGMKRRRLSPVHVGALVCALASLVLRRIHRIRQL